MSHGVLNYNIFCSIRKLTPRQKELITEFARTENLVDGTVNGVEEGQIPNHQGR